MGKNFFKITLRILWRRKDFSAINFQRQLRYARNRNAGYDRNRLLYTFSQGGNWTQYESIRRGLLASGAAVAVTRTFSPMTRAWNNVTNLSRPGSTPDDRPRAFVRFEADMAS